MKDLKQFLLEDHMHDAEDVTNDMMKIYKGKTVDLQSFLNDMENEYYWNYDDSQTTDNELYFWGNFSNKARESDLYLKLTIEKHGSKIKVLDYEITR